MRNITVLYIEKTRNEAQAVIKQVKEALPGVYLAVASDIRLPEDRSVLICTYSTQEALNVLLHKKFKVDLVILELENEHQMIEWSRISKIRQALNYGNNPIWVYTQLEHYRKKCMQEYGVQFVFGKKETGNLVNQLVRVCSQEATDHAVCLQIPTHIYPQGTMNIQDIISIRIEDGIHHIYYVNHEAGTAHNLNCERFPAHNEMLKMMEDNLVTEMIRINRSCMVNRNYIKAIKGIGRDQYLLLYQTGSEKFNISYESYLKGVKEYLGDK
jgi:hypothetical protein